MTRAAPTPATQPIVRLAGESPAPHAHGQALGQAQFSPRVAAIVVTWNRRDAVDHVLRALAAQNTPAGTLDVIVIDNASTDGTFEHLAEHWAPDCLVDNPTAAAHEPAFRLKMRAPPEVRRGPFASLTLVRNSENHGGCGGFNTGFSFVEQVLDAAASARRPDYVWLVDDDVDLPPGALRQLLRTAQSDPAIGVVGSRAVDFHRRDTTIETTIYFDPRTGSMDPDPPPHHRLHGSHQEWLGGVGSTRGAGPYTGVREVDVVAACSLLARWEAVKRVGFWDHRFFIYCDDADWCLRFPAAGFKVVCDLDAVVYHTFWLQKLTPVRAYYSERNLMWLMHKAVPRKRLRRALFRRMGRVLLDSRKALTHCRLFHAEIIRRTVEDLIVGRGGRLDEVAPSPAPVLEALRGVGALAPDATIAVMGSRASSIEAADELRAAVAAETGSSGPAWLYIAREGLAEERDRRAPAATAGGRAAADRHSLRWLTYAPDRWSKLRAQRALFFRPPTVTVVFDQANDFPLVRSRWNLHIDRRTPTVGQLERDGVRRRVAFAARWAWTALRAAAYIARVRPHAPAASPTGKFG